jgi:Ni2+-binding GTPase involved in maturation of urease and hydrogenase
VLIHQPGYLGAGKTTLLNYILTAQHGKKIAVIMNGVYAACPAHDQRQYMYLNSANLPAVNAEFGDCR